MKCSSCDTEMEDGEAIVPGGFLRFLFLHVLSENLYFRFRTPPQSFRLSPCRKKVLAAGHARSSHHCPNCGGLFIQGK